MAREYHLYVVSLKCCPACHSALFPVGGSLSPQLRYFVVVPQKKIKDSSIWISRRAVCKVLSNAVFSTAADFYCGNLHWKQIYRTTVLFFPTRRSYRAYCANSFTCPEEFWEEKSMSRGLWPPRSLDLSVRDMNRTQNSKRNLTTNLMNFNISSVMVAIMPEELRTMPMRGLKGTERCILVNGSHSQYLRLLTCYFLFTWVIYEKDLLGYFQMEHLVHGGHRFIALANLQKCFAIVKIRNRRLDVNNESGTAIQWQHGVDIERK